jgi:hypothetical protein
MSLEKICWAKGTLLPSVERRLAIQRLYFAARYRHAYSAQSAFKFLDCFDALKT